MLLKKVMPVEVVLLSYVYLLDSSGKHFTVWWLGKNNIFVVILFVTS